MTFTAKPDPQRIWAVIQAIPRGETASYGQVAMRAGLPGRARWVAQLLASGQGPVGLPWHRVVRSDGRIAFDPDSAGYLEQVQRLRAEGIPVTAGKVRLTDTRRNLDEALWR